MLVDELTKCELRGLWIRPARDCRHCAWYECEQHPKHVMWPAIQRVLVRCNTMRRYRPDCKGKKKKPWDGTQEHCARFNAKQGGKYGEHPCANCTLDRPCEHRGERGRWLVECAQREKTEQDRETRNANRYITKVGKRFRVRYIRDGRRVTVGTYGTVEEARIARDVAFVKLDREIADVPDTVKGSSSVSR